MRTIGWPASERLRRLYPVRAPVRRVAQIDEQTIGAIGRWIAERLVGNRNDAASVLAGRFGDQLLDPGAEDAIERDAMSVSLSRPLLARTPMTRPSVHTGIVLLARWPGRTPAPSRLLFQEGGNGVPSRRQRDQAEFRQNGIAPADAGNAEEDAAKAFALGGLLQPRARIGDGDEMGGRPRSRLQRMRVRENNPSARSARACCPICWRR